MPVYAPSPARPKAQTLRCPACGAPCDLRNPGRTQSLTCAYCDTVIDTRDDNLAIVFKWNHAAKEWVRIPLGTRGKLRGVDLECLAFLRREVVVDGQTYAWSEYLLYNPHKGYRWLTEANGHWTLMTECIGLPSDTRGPLAANLPVTSVYYGGMSFKHFQTSMVTTTYCLGEAYWQIHRNDQVIATDYVCPPYMLSAEQTGDEIVWSIGEYIPEAEVAAAFKFEASLCDPVGVGPCQPNPVEPATKAWIFYLMYCAAAFLLTLFFSVASQNKLVTTVQDDYRENVAERTKVSEVFELTGRPSNVVVKVGTGALDQRWAFFKLALINEDTLEAIDFGAETAWYHGVDDGESWSEGSPTAEVVVPHVPAGHYFLRVEPESGQHEKADQYDPKKTFMVPHAEMEKGPDGKLHLVMRDTPAQTNRIFSYTVEVRRDIVRFVWLWWVFLGLLPWPLVQSMRYSAFENRRWSESDHAPVSSDSGSDD